MRQITEKNYTGPHDCIMKLRSLNSKPNWVRVRVRVMNSTSQPREYLNNYTGTEEASLASKPSVREEPWFGHETSMGQACSLGMRLAWDKHAVLV